MLPSTLQNQGRGSYLPSPNRLRGEEQKRANSVASGDTIISTASSNSPLKRKNISMKKNLQYNGLQITGQSRGGIQANIPMNKYSKFASNNARQSPYLSKAGARKGSSSNLRGTGASNTDSELYGNGGGIQPLHARPGQ